MSATATVPLPTTTPTPTERVLVTSLVLAPLLYLAADTTYAARGFDDATAGVLHVLGALVYGLVPLWAATRLPARSRLAALVVVTGLVGMAGNVAYGFETIHVSLGDDPLVDRPGAANLIKPLGLFFPLSLGLVALTLARIGHRWPAAVVVAAVLGWPVAHIGDIAAVAIPVNVALVIALGTLAWGSTGIQPTDRSTNSR